MSDTDVAIWFFTILTLMANIATLSVIALALGRRAGNDSATRAWRVVWPQLVDAGTLLALGVAATSLLGSLYFSEIADFSPCRLCWAQRAVMYPLVPILGLALVWRGRARLLRWIGIGLAAVGVPIVVYHLVLERFPSLESGTCDPSNPCSLIWFERLGFVTMPYMALSAFVVIITLLISAQHSVAPAPLTPRPKENS